MNIREIAHNLYRLGADAGQVAATEAERVTSAYLRVLAKVSVVSFTMAVSAIVGLIVAAGFDAPSWVFVAAAMVLAAASIIEILATAPVLLVLDGLRRTAPGLVSFLWGPVRLALTVAFFALFLAMLALSAPVDPSPRLLLFFVFTSTVAALGAYLGYVNLSPGAVRSFVTAKLLLCFVYIAFAALLPQFAGNLRGMWAELDARLASQVAVSREVAVRDIESLRFYDDAGKPRFAFEKIGDEYRLYNAGEINRYGEPMELIDSKEKVDLVVEYFRSRFKSTNIDELIFDRGRRNSVAGPEFWEEVDPGSKQMNDEHADAWTEEKLASQRAPILQVEKSEGGSVLKVRVQSGNDDDLVEVDAVPKDATITYWDSNRSIRVNRAAAEPGQPVLLYPAAQRTQDGLSFVRGWVYAEDLTEHSDTKVSAEWTKVETPNQIEWWIELAPGQQSPEVLLAAPKNGDVGYDITSNQYKELLWSVNGGEWQKPSDGLSHLSFPVKVRFQAPPWVGPEVVRIKVYNKEEVTP